MYLYFLGTGAGKPSLRRNVTGIAFKLPDPSREVWLFDCGEGTQHQLLASPFGLHRITKIFITHLHGDHIFGLPGLLGSRSFSTDDVGLEIYGPPGIKEFIECALKASSTHIRYPLHIQEIEPGEVLHFDPWIVRTTLLEHVLPSYGYRFEEPQKPGRLLVEKLQELDIAPGPIYGRLKQGEKVVLENRRVLDGRDFVGPPIRGRHVVILGDTRRCPSTVELSKEANLLVHEATLGAELAENAYDYFHSSTVDAAQTAKEAGVQKLVLTHISSRYHPHEYEELLAEAQSVFPNTVLAEDHTTVEVPKSVEEGL